MYKLSFKNYHPINFNFLDIKVPIVIQEIHNKKWYKITSAWEHPFEAHLVLTSFNDKPFECLITGVPVDKEPILAKDVCFYFSKAFSTLVGMFFKAKH